MYDDKRRLRDIANEAKKNAYMKYLPQYKEFYKHFLYPSMVKEAEQGNFSICIEVRDDTVEYLFFYNHEIGRLPKNKYTYEILRVFLDEEGYSIKTKEENNNFYINISW